MDSTSGPRPIEVGHFGAAVSVASTGLVVVGAPTSHAAFLFAINETSPGNASLVLLADLIPVAGGFDTAATNYGTMPCLIVCVDRRLSFDMRAVSYIYRHVGDCHLFRIGGNRGYFCEQRR